MEETQAQSFQSSNQSQITQKNFIDLNGEKKIAINAASATSKIEDCGLRRGNSDVGEEISAGLSKSNSSNLVSSQESAYQFRISESKDRLPQQTKAVF